MSQTKITLDDCAKEPIHLSGAIQPHGVLLGIQLTTNTVEYASENVSTVFDLELDHVLGKPSGIVLSAIKPGTKEVHKFTFGSYQVIEFESLAGGRGDDDAERMLREVQAITSADSIEQLNQLTADAVQRLTGFQRIMIYKFAEDWTGTVLAETIINGSMPSFLDLRFPASDIPEQARRLYSEKLLRYIPSVSAVPVPILPSPASSSLDLSASDLRSVSPIHIEYLKNMDVGASMSLSVMVDGRLWGLIACHDTNSKAVSIEMREHCKILCALYSRLLATHQQAAKERERADSKITQIALLDRLSTYENFAEGLSDNDNLLLQLVHAPGAILSTEDGCITLGDAPRSEHASNLVSQVFNEDELMVVTDHLNPINPNGELIGVSGLLAINLSATKKIWLTWVRPEVVSEVNWAGEPTKVDLGDTQLHPRRSFSMWKETVSGYSQPWTDEEVSAAKALRQYLQLKIERDSAEKERNRLNVALADSNQKLVQFVDTISHDLRSPLISIGNLADWIEKDMGDKSTGSVKENILLLQKRAGKMRAQLNELLDYSKAGNYRAAPETVDTDLLVRSIVEEFNCDKTMSIVVKQMPTVETVKAPLEHVFHNLIENAVKYTDKPNTQIVIGCDDKGKFFEFYVQDEGKGVPEEYLQEIFLPLRTLSGGDSESHGMGLAFVQRLVEQAGGEVKVQSEFGKGSRFSFTWKKVWEKTNGN